MNLKIKMKRAAFVISTLAVLLVAGFNGKALAVDINQGDLVLAIFGNSTEYIQNLGSANTLLTPGTTTNFNISPSTLSAVGGINPPAWTLIGFSFDPSTGNPTFLQAGSSKPPSAYTPTELASVSINFPWNAAAVWAALSSGDGLSQKLLPASDPNSFTSNFGTSGTLAGGFPVAMQGGFGSTLSIIQGDYSTNALSLLGQGTLSANGLLTISGLQVAPVPIPAAIILFGTGLVGLVGVARRNLMAA